MKSPRGSGAGMGSTAAGPGARAPWGGSWPRALGQLNWLCARGWVVRRGVGGGCIRNVPKKITKARLNGLKPRELFAQAQSDSILPHLAVIEYRLTPSCWRVGRWKDAWKAPALPRTNWLAVALSSIFSSGEEQSMDLSQSFQSFQTFRRLFTLFELFADFSNFSISGIPFADFS